MNIMQRTKRAGLIGTISAVLAGLGLSGIIAAGVPVAQAEETGSITVNFSTKENGQPDAIEGARFNVYKIGTWDGSQGKYVPVAPFDADPFDQIGGVDADGNAIITITDVMGADADQLRQLSTTLSNYIKEASQSSADIEPVADGNTNDEGVVVFDGLERGLYLVDAPLHQISGTTAQGKNETDEYVISSSLVALPNVNSNTPMDVAITAKATHSSGLDPIHVEKVWKNDDPATRPTSIKISLWMEGQDSPIATETLSADNDWSCVWDNLPVGNRYFVVEDDVPDGYHVFIDEDIINPETADFTITNSKPEQPRQPEQPGQPGQPGQPTTPTAQVTPGRPARTGADIAVVAIMAAAAIGIAMVLIFEVRKARARENK